MKKNQKGFNLIELLIVVAILSVLAAFSAQFVQMIDKQRMTYYANKIIDGVHMASFLATQLDTNIKICPISAVSNSNIVTCATNPNATGLSWGVLQQNDNQLLHYLLNQPNNALKLFSSEGSAIQIIVNNKGQLPTSSTSKVIICMSRGHNKAMSIDLSNGLDSIALEYIDPYGSNC